MAEHLRRDRRDRAPSRRRRPSTTRSPRSTAPAGCSSASSALFYNLTSSETSPALQAVEREMAPRLAAHDSAVYMHRGAVRAHRRAARRRATSSASTPSSAACSSASTSTSCAPARSSAPAEQARYAEIMQRLAELTTASARTCSPTSRPSGSLLRDEAELAGLPRLRARRGAPGRASSAASPTPALVTLSRSHIVPFLTFSERRDLREQAWRAWTSRGEHAGRERQPRASRARSWRCASSRRGCTATRSYADYALGDTMAGSQAAVTTLLEQVWAPAWARAEAEREALEALALSRGEPARDRALGLALLRREGAPGPLRPRRGRRSSRTSRSSGWSRRRSTAPARLFGLRFVARPEIVAYHPDVRVYEVRGADGRPVGIFLHDNFARPTKRSGAWMSSYRVQSRNGDGGGDRCCRSSSTTTTSRRPRPASRRCSASTTRARCSTSSATACTACSRT